MASLRVLGVMAAGSLLVAATPFDPQGFGIFNDRSLCKFELADNMGQAWQFDLTSIGGSTLSFAVPPYTYNFSLCGIAGGQCVPSAGQLWPLAPGYQFQGAESGECYSSMAGGFVPCTNFCEGIASGPPLHSLLDPANGNGGIMTSYLGMWTPETDGEKCGDWDPTRGREYGRSMQVCGLVWCGVFLACALS
jgi:hypothetical protein